MESLLHVVLLCSPTKEGRLEDQAEARETFEETQRIYRFVRRTYTLPCLGMWVSFLWVYLMLVTCLMHTFQVLGASGYLGQYLCDRFSHSRFSVRGTYRTPSLLDSIAHTVEPYYLGTGPVPILILCIYVLTS